jgi:hypothetical protein
METITTRFIDKAIDGLKNAATELEKFQLQLSLGKAEASDKYEEVKKKFDGIIHDAKKKLSEDKAKAVILRRKFDELELQFALAKAETKEGFKEQKGKVLKTIQEIENLMKNGNK